MLKKLQLLYPFILIFWSCAVQVPPSGGPKDVNIPKVIKIIPVNKTLNFDRQEIHFIFDEFVVLKNPEEQIVVSPPLEETPEYSVSGRNLKVSLRGALKRNTTYTINFGNAIADNHEGNVLENLCYVFSTGNTLDSNIISGFIYNSFTAKPEKNIVVGLYSANEFYDSLIYKSKPEYFGKTKDGGWFSIENIPNKRFVLVGFNDENKNLKYTKNESIVFSKEGIDPTDSLLRKQKHFIYDPNTYSINHIIDTFSRERGKFGFIVYKPTSFSVKPNKDVPSYTQLKRVKNNADTIYVLSNDLKRDSLVGFRVIFSDTNFIVNIVSKNKNKLPGFSALIFPTIELKDTFFINFTNPCRINDPTKIVLKEDTNIVKPTLIKILSLSEKQGVYYQLKEKTKYSLLIKDSAYIDIFGQYNKRCFYETTIKAQKDYSSLFLKIILSQSSKHYIIQLISDDEVTVFKELYLDKGVDILFETLIPGKYKIKIICDSNNNGVWDNGEYFLNRSAEMVYYSKEIITLKAFWDLEQTIDLDKILLIN
jgi:hypothetical protein